MAIHRHANRHCDPDRHPDPDHHRDADGHGDADENRNPHSHCHRDTNGHTHAWRTLFRGSRYPALYRQLSRQLQLRTESERSRLCLPMS